MLAALLAAATLASRSATASPPVGAPVNLCPADQSRGIADDGNDPDLPPWAKALTSGRDTTFRRTDATVHSADGTQVSVRSYLPDEWRGPKPTVLVFSPYHSALGFYGKDLEEPGIVDFADCIIPFLLRRGYAVVLGDMRGTRNTDGCFDYGGPGDQQDGYAVVEWIAAQPWSNGRVGMYGASHPGMSQYAAAVTNPPHLEAIIPIAPITSFWRYLYSGGAHYEINMFTPAAYDYAVAGPPPTNVTAANYPTNLLDTVCGTKNVLKGMSLDGSMDAYWRARDYPSMAHNIKAAVFHAHGTLDDNVKMDHFAAIWKALEANNVPRKALIGPWGHAEPAVDFWYLHALRWYEHWLRGRDTGVMREPAVTMLDQEKIERRSATYPAAPGRVLELAAGGGKLGPRAAEATAIYRDIPHLLRNALMSATTARLLYASEPVRERVRISGTPIFELVAALDTGDTNFSVHLFHVPDGGIARRITRGYLDAQHRAGLDRAEPVTPGVFNRYRIEMHADEFVFEPGDRIQVMLSSSDSCPYLVGVVCGDTGIVSDPTAATVTVREGTGLTRLLLPVAPA